MDNLDIQVQIYVPSCNYGRYLSKALDSIVSQTFKRWHCYIIDEASSDDTSAIASDYIQNYGCEKFTFIKNIERLGLQKLSNWVFNNTEAPYVIRLDADDYWMPDLLEKLYPALQNNSKAALAFGGYIYISQSGAFLDEEPSVNYLNRYVSGLDAPHGACTLIDRQKFIDGGLYYECVDAQDGWDLWLKSYPKYEFIAIEEPLFYYRQHPSSLSRNSDRIFRARRKILSMNFDNNSREKVQPIIPVGVNLDLNAKRVRSHFDYIINALSECESLHQPLITVDDEKQLVAIKKLNIGCKLSFTQNKYKYGMNPFKLLDDISCDCDAKMWLNFNTKNIDSYMIKNALNTFGKFNFDTCISVMELREPVFKLTSDGLCCLGNGRYADYKLKADELWRMNNILVIKRKLDNCLPKEPILGYFEMSAEESKLIHDW